MKKNKLILPLIIGVLALSGMGAVKAQTSLAEAKKAIEASNAIYFQAFAKQDSSIFISRYAEDCWIMPPNAPSLCGPDAPLDFYKKAFSLGLRNGEFITIDVYGVSEDVVAEIGFWRSINAQSEVYDNGKYLVLWKKTAKGWKMWRDSFSSDTE